MHPYKLACQAITEHGAIQKSQELGGLLALAMDLDPLDTVVEIGSFDGGTLWAWQQICSNVIGVDLPPPGHEETVRLNNLGCPIVCGDSHDPATVIRLLDLLDELDATVDMLFVDGDHTYDGVRTDFALYGPLVRPGGLIAFHDICGHPNMEFVEVNRFWATLEGDQEIFVSEPHTWGGIGVLRVPGDDNTETARRADRRAANLQAQEASYGTPRRKVNV